MDILLIADENSMGESLAGVLGAQDQLHFTNDVTVLSEQLGSLALASPLIDFCILDLAADSAQSLVPAHVGKSELSETLAQCFARLNLTFGLPLVYINSSQEEAVSTCLADAGDDLLSKDRFLTEFKYKHPVYMRWAARFRESMSVQDELSRMSMVDTATQLPNYRGFNQELVKNWGQMKRDHHALGLILLEVDKFADHQQAIGQAMLNESIQTLALILEGSLSRPLDTVFRLSSSRFAILLPNTNGQGATKVGQAVMRHITEANITLADTVARSEAEESVRPIMQVSMSAVSFSPKQIVQYNTQALTRFAEDVLEAAQLKGGNRILSGEQSALAAG